MANKSKLTIKQKKFCELYAASGNAYRSFMEAGYKVTSEGAAIKNASNLVHKNGNVKKYLAQLAEESKTEAICDIQEMQEILTKIIREEADEEVLMNEGYGEGMSRIVSKRKAASLKDRLSAISQLAKMQGVAEKVEITGTLPVTFIDDLSDDLDTQTINCMAKI